MQDPASEKTVLTHDEMSLSESYTGIVKGPIVAACVTAVIGAVVLLSHYAFAGATAGANLSSYATGIFSFGAVSLFCLSAHPIRFHRDATGFRTDYWWRSAFYEASRLSLVVYEYRFSESSRTFMWARLVFETADLRRRSFVLPAENRNEAAAKIGPRARRVPGFVVEDTWGPEYRSALKRFLAGNDGEAEYFDLLRDDDWD